ncbi:hypothetical protein KUCAC02_011335 [Chaenocephalus aceratus]|uniref:Uncharacterized protein n=1 Tax=Chaenocephalus aceratus TaxID=36190 RepID=A0ACB9WVG4_CHAAC|nr:hypothetical protein KUCAC02_011335 [Chaenocephalus aceratus]
MFVEAAMNYFLLDQDGKYAVRLRMGCTAGVSGIRECHQSPLRLGCKYELCGGTNSPPPFSSELSTGEDERTRPTRRAENIKRHIAIAAGCTFDEDLDPGLCEYRQGQDDDFDWQLIRTFNWPHPTPDLLRELIMIM